MWKLSIEDDQGNKTVVNLVRDEYSLGRAEDNTVRLTERNISRHHAYLQRNGSGWLIEDKQSYNGCFVNGVRVTEPQRLEHGDLVQVGDYRLEVTDDAVVGAGTARAATVPAVPKSQMLLGQPDRLVMLVGPTPGAEFALASERVVIGRGEECDIAINHSSVSRVHAEVHALGDGRYELVDRESANGIRLNGVELQRGLIDARDTIELGDVVLKFIPAGQIYRPGADESQQINAVSRAALERMTPTPGVERGVGGGGIPAGVKAVAAVFGLGVLVVLGIVAFRGGSSSDGGKEVAAATDGASKVLADAAELVKQGNLEAAHMKIIEEIPEDSNARQSQEFRDIEARWADALFEQAANEADPTAKRAILDRIAKSTSVDSVRRKRAATEVEKLEAGGVAVTDLPSAPQPTAKPDAAVAKVGTHLKGGIVRKDPFGGGSTTKAKPPPTASYPKQPTQPASTGKSPNTNDLGDRSKLTAYKNSLKSKVASGKASDKEAAMLRALCRQLGDMSCAN